MLKQQRIPVWIKFAATLVGCGIAITVSAFILEGCNESKANVPSAMSSQKLPETVDFNFHIRPILSDRCYTCHGPDGNKREANLRLDTEAGAMAPLESGEGFAIIPGKTEESKLYLRIASHDTTDMMPPPASNLKVSAYEKALIGKWIAQGAEWKTHWSFIPPNKPSLPSVTKPEWPKNEIDNFVMARLAQDEIEPAAEAEKAVLIRRLSFDLRGLPPTLEEVDDFLADSSKGAYEALIDRFMDTDAYAERMATEWLDVARYADSHGYQDDLERFMWPWRDWVIHAFRQNMPYDKFIQWQLAGDLLPNPTNEQILATGFNRNHMINQEGGIIAEEYRVEYVADRTITTSMSLLGLTLECARCHDHKYDPILQKDFYQFFAFFNSVSEKGQIDYGEIPGPFMELDGKTIKETLAFVKDIPEDTTFKFMVMEDMDTVRQAYILIRGGYDNHGEAVVPSTPSALPPFPENAPRNRLGLAQWLTQPNNPLTARVAVNRYWQMHFGKGIVGTPDDFGNQGSLPTHPALLDWLATYFVASGWDIQALHKKILMSATYRQDSRPRQELQEIDPSNELLARGPRHRLTAEMIRDQALAVSNLLNNKVGGRSVKPYQPKGLWSQVTGGGGGSLAMYVQDEKDKLYRKSMYTFWKRTVPPPSMMTFDTPERNRCTLKRQATSTPLQALVLLNDPQFIEASRLLAYRMIAEGGKTVEERIAFAFRTITGRIPNMEEKALLAGYFEKQYARFQADELSAEELLEVGEFPHDTCLETAEAAAFTLVASSIFNLNEAVTKS